MCLDAIEVTPGAVEHRPHSGPEQCKYCILAYIIFLFGLKFKVYDIAYFLCVCYSYNFEKTGTYVEETQYRSMGSSTIFRILYNLIRIQTFNIWPYSSKQTPENLCNAGFFSLVSIIA